MTHIMTQENKDCLFPVSLKYAKDAQAQVLLECHRSLCYFHVFSGFATCNFSLMQYNLAVTTGKTRRQKIILLISYSN